MADQDPQKNRRGLLVILSSPSGAGKSTLSRKLLAWDDSLRFSVSATTRKARAGETHGKDYYFETPSSFKTMIATGKMLEYAQVFGHYYGSPRAPVEHAIEQGYDVLFDVDWQGGQQIRQSALSKDVVSVFILPPSIKALESRLHSRGQDSAEVVAARMAQSHSEISHWAEYDYVLVNDDLDDCFASLCTILRATRLRRDSRPDLIGHVAQLNKEFKGS